MIRKRRNQKEMPIPKTKVGKNKVTNRYLHPLSFEFAVSAFRSIKFFFSFELAVSAFRSIKFLCKSGNCLFYFRTETVSHLTGVLKIYSAFIFR